MSEEEKIKNDPDIKRVERLMQISSQFYNVHKELESYPGNITTVRQDIIKVCEGLDRVRSQIIGKTTGEPENPGQPSEK